MKTPAIQDAAGAGSNAVVKLEDGYTGKSGIVTKQNQLCHTIILYPNPTDAELVEQIQKGL